MNRIVLSVILLNSLFLLGNSQTVTIWSEGFEGSMSAYQSGSYCGNVVCNWADKNCKSYAGNWSAYCAASGASCTGASNCSSYPNNLCNYFKKISPINISCYKNRVFSFRIWREMGNNDELHAVCRYDGSTSWSTLGIYSGSQTSWVLYSYSIPNNVSTIEWQFDFITNSIGYNEDGAFIDDMKITGEPIMSDNFIASISYMPCGFVDLGWMPSYGATGYRIYRDGNLITTLGPNATSYSQNPVPAGSYIYSICAYNSCYNTHGYQLCADHSVQVLPVPYAIASNNGPYCEGASIYLSASGGNNYSWSGPGGYSSSQQNPVRNNANVSMGGTYYVTVTNSSGCSAIATTNVTVNAIPNPVIVTGGGTHCEIANLTASGGDGGTIYWQGTNSNGTSTSTPSINQTVTSSGTYYFRARSSAGCWGQEGSATVTINPAPGAVTVNGSGTYCESTILTATGGYGGTIYWQGTASNGTSTSTPSTNQTVTTTGTYYFRARSSAGCWGPQGSATVTINHAPGPVTVNGGGTYPNSALLTAIGGSGGTIYWQGTTHNGTNTSFPTSSQTVNSSGTYYFRAMSNGCWGQQGSATVTITNNTGIEDITSIKDLVIYPNPNNGVFTITFEMTRPEKIEIRILNLSGQIVYQERVTFPFGTSNRILDLNVLSKSLYILDIVTNEGVISNKILIQ